MATEHGPDTGGPDPIEFFFPEADPGGTVDHETVLITERRVRVMRLYRQRQGMRAIAAAVGCSLGTVHADIHAVLDGYKRQAVRDAGWHLADMLERLNHIEGEIAADLERSRGEFVETSATRRPAAGGGTQDQHAVKKRSKYGDPRLLALLAGCWDRRARLLGLLKDQDRQAAAPVKLVAGVDPQDLV